MKKFLTIIMAGVNTLAFAQKKMDLSRSIDDNGEKLSIRVSGTVDGKTIDYERTYIVSGLSKSERNSLADHVLDSLGVGKIEAPSPPSAPSAPSSPVAPKPPVHLSANDSGTYVSAVHSETESKPSFSGKQTKGFSKEIRFNDESGELYLRYHFMRGDEDFLYEKTVDASDKSERERQIIIHDFENEIALPVQ